MIVWWRKFLLSTTWTNPITRGLSFCRLAFIQMDSRYLL